MLHKHGNLFIGLVASLLLILSGIGPRAASAEEDVPRLFCEPKQGLEVEDVKGINDLGDCRFAASAQEQPEEGEIEVSIYPKPAGGTTVREPLGMNEWMGDQVSLPSPVPADSWLLLHGDVRGDGTCAIMVFGSGETVDHPSEATWQAYLLHGGTVEMMTAEVVEYIQPVVERETNGCPIIHQPQGVDLGAELEKALEDEA